MLQKSAEFMLKAGEGISDITPPKGVELAGFHKPPGQERTTKGVRQPTHARALVLEANGQRCCIVSIDVLGFDADFATILKQAISKSCRIPVKFIRITASHSHSTPTLVFLRQWGAVSFAYKVAVQRQAERAAMLAVEDLAEASLYYGKQTVIGGNFNRTAKTWKTEDQFTSTSTDSERWLDRSLQVLNFVRDRPKKSIVWYHFSAHPVCYTDELSGPDWPGLVASRFKEQDGGVLPGFLQGHIGDVNPGDGKVWLGNPEEVSENIYKVLHHATNHSELIPVKKISARTFDAVIPCDMKIVRQQVATYEREPENCTKGEWVDAGFAKDWYESARRWKNRNTLGTSLSLLKLGDLNLVFHAAELYSFYGLQITRAFPGPTLLVGYTDDFVGYVTDSAAYEKREYAAMVVPKILGLPPFTPQAGREFAKQAIRLASA